MALHLISYVNTCVTTATTDAFELQSKEIRYQPAVENETITVIRLGSARNGTVMRREPFDAMVEKHLLNCVM